MNFLFEGAPVIFGIFFCLVLGFMIFIWVKLIKTQIEEKKAPEIQSEGLIASKRIGVGKNGETAYTSYFATVEYPDGSRKEFKVKDSVFGMIAEGDRGVATTKGSWLIAFCRTDASGGTASAEGWHKCEGCGAVYKGEVCEYCGTPWMKGK